MEVIGRFIGWGAIGFIAYVGLVARPKYLGAFSRYLGYDTYGQMREWANWTFIMTLMVTAAYGAFSGSLSSGGWERLLALGGGVAVGYVFLLLLPESTWRVDGS